MRRYQLATQNDAINLALQMLAAETASIDEARSRRGIGWDGDLDAIRSSRAPRNLVDTYHGRFGLSGVSNRLTFSKCLTTASPAACDRPKQLQTPLEDRRRTARQIEYTKVARDFDGVSNRLTFSKCLTTASSARCDRPKQLQTPREDGRERRETKSGHKVKKRDFEGVPNRLIRPKVSHARIASGAGAGRLSVHTLPTPVCPPGRDTERGRVP